MKRYVNCYPSGAVEMFADIDECRLTGHQHEAYAVAVEVELPDPPRQWKVGDWFRWTKWDRWPIQIVDIFEDYVALRWRVVNELGAGPNGCVVPMSSLHDAVICDPPGWFLWDGEA